ncbi:alpha/beta-hydrolase [Byssothecium circinans]|uniref:Alpha/beta-hydrolase n=1 Tax=Byssothecium circinans TaxID=147558 RepID=A0A6A5UJ28_9PLEO|nr:alpha/beta-hydrolase [Byssothecium circinans]
MTETCAGAIYSLECPEADVKNGRSAASRGKCMREIEMRVTVPTSGNSTPGETITIAMPGQPGDLEARSNVVFKGYYRDAHATADAFTADGWFRTGDQATIDSEDNLHLIGRVKNVTNINGVKFATSDIQMSVEQAINMRVARVIRFPSRAVHTEQVTVAYTPKAWPMEPGEMDEIEELAGQACILITGSRPLIFSLLESSLSTLPISTLGKISRAKMTSLFQAGVFNENVLLHHQCIDDFRKRKHGSVAVAAQAATPAESLLIEDFVDVLDVSPDIVCLDTRIFDLGCTSMDMMRFKRRIDTRLGVIVPIIMLMRSPTPRDLAADLGLNAQIQSSHNGSESQTVQPATITPTIDCAPVVTFWSSSPKTPLWLMHPGVGEVLVFVGLVQHLHNDDRPVYALRARGFEASQECFTSIDETVTTHVNAIRQQQPNGPYTIAGYSYGTMLAFEVAKRLDAADGGSVKFLGSFNLPPHIKTRMRQMNWNMCLLHLSWFLDLISEEHTNGIDEHSFRAETRDIALNIMLRAARQSRLDELGLRESELIQWTNVAFGLQSMAVDYEPSRQVDAIDIFHAIPLKVVAVSQEEWVSEHLSRWSDFSKTKPRFHHVGGAHYTMIGPDHVSKFSQTLMAALRS